MTRAAGYLKLNDDQGPGRKGPVVAQTFTALTVDAPTALSNLDNENFPIARIAVMCLRGSKQDVRMQIQKVRSLTRTPAAKSALSFFYMV